MNTGDFSRSGRGGGVGQLEGGEGRGEIDELPQYSYFCYPLRYTPLF